MLIWNVDGFLSKLDDPDFVQSLQSFSLICLCETFVEYLDLSQRFIDFVVHILPAKKLSTRGRRSGGILCLVHKSIDKHVIRLECSFDFIVFKVSRALFGTDRDVLLFNAYVPPKGSPYYEMCEEQNGILNLENCINEITEKHGDMAIILCGDLNARTARRNVIDMDLRDMVSDMTSESRYSDDCVLNQYGQHLLSLCVVFNLIILNGHLDETSGKFTYVSSNGSSVIDYLIVSADIIPFFRTLCVKETVLSPHMRLEAEFKCIVEHNGGRSEKETTQTKIIWQKHMAPTFVENLQENLARPDIMQILRKERGINVDRATKSITDVLLTSAGFLTKTFRGLANRKHRWFDKECKQGKKSAKQKLRRYIISHDERDRKAYIESRKLYKELIRHKKANYRRRVTETLTTNVTDAQLFWKEIKALSGSYTRRTQCRVTKDEWVEHFQNIFAATLSDTEPQSIVWRTGINVPDTYDADILDADITANEVAEAIKHTKGGRAPGADGILADMIRSASGLLLPYLLKLFNSIFQKSYFPKQWTESIIVPIHKKGTADDPNNYRGISLISNLSKIFMHVLKNRLQQWVEVNDVIGEEQAGFRKGYSTTDHIFVLHSLIQRYLSRHKKFYVAFVDFSKAFDTVDRQTLWLVLSQLGLTVRMGKMLQAIYESVKCCVRCDGMMSDFFECSGGLKQGCKLSPILFSMLMTSLTKEICHKGKHGVQLVSNGVEIFLLLFADDVALLSDTALGLQNQISSLEAAADRLGLKVNTQKTKVMTFRLGGHIAEHERWYYKGQKLEVVSSYRYLGVTLSTKLCTNSILTDLASRGRVAVLRMMRSLRQLVHIAPNVLNTIFDVQIQPILLYGAEIWGVDDCKAIEAIHLLALKQYLNVSLRTPNTMVYGETGRYSLHINAILRAVKYWYKVLKMDNERFPRLVYLSMLNTENKNWASKIKDILFKYGLSEVWVSQTADNEREVLKILRERLIEEFTQQWRSMLDISQRY